MTGGVRIKQQRDTRQYMNRRSAPPILLLSVSLPLSLPLCFPLSGRAGLPLLPPAERERDMNIHTASQPDIRRERGSER